MEAALIHYIFLIRESTVERVRVPFLLFVFLQCISLIKEIYWIIEYMLPQLVCSFKF